MFFVLCVCSAVIIFSASMANIDDLGFLANGFDQDVTDKEVEEPVVHRRSIVDVQTSESEQEDLGGGGSVKDSSLLDSSSDSPVKHKVPSVSPGRKYTDSSVPKPPGQVPTV